jgi:hypothetical protein
MLKLLLMLFREVVVQRIGHHRCVASSPLTIRAMSKVAIGQRADFNAKNVIFDASQVASK